MAIIALIVGLAGFVFGWTSWASYRELERDVMHMQIQMWGSSRYQKRHNGTA